MRPLIVPLLFGLFGSQVVHAQVAVTDPAVTLRNSVTAAIKEHVLNTQRDQHSQLRRMAQRLSLFTNLAKYRLPDPPLWRIHDFENPDVFLFARAYHAALNYGDAAGAAYGQVTDRVTSAQAILGALTPAARRAIAADLATIDVADASAIAAIHSSGQLRFNGRRELRAIEALDAHVTDPSNEQSATAVLDKISGAVLIGSRQRQARTQLLAGVVEQLLVDSKRARDTEASAMNTQITTLRHGRQADAAFISGSGDALRTWRQP